MRHIPLKKFLLKAFADSRGKRMRKTLSNARKKLRKMTTTRRGEYVASNGAKKWSPLKNALLSKLGNKCWYTEVELVGAPLAIDHFRPICHYWWLTFDPENYRIACPFSNSPQHNAAQGCAG